MIMIFKYEVMDLGREGFEQLMGFHAAPMLVGLRPASLLSFRRDKFADFDALLEDYRPCFSCKGIEIFPVAQGEVYVLLLFYRAELLKQQFQDKAVQKVLRQYGYPCEEGLTACLHYLQLRMRLKKSFPHEIGLFLGYPVADVVGFITHKGQDFCYSGYWKVYANEEETRALFDCYAHCTEEFCAKLEAGCSFPELVKAV